MAQEVLRLEPPVQITFRKALQDTDIAGTPVPAGTTTMLSWAKAIKSAGPGAGTFDPAHWLTRGADGDDATGGTAPNREPGNLVWGHGPRRCIGQSLATIEITVFLATLAREAARVDMRPEEAARPFINPVFGPHPTGLPVTLPPRA